MQKRWEDPESRAKLLEAIRRGNANRDYSNTGQGRIKGLRVHQADKARAFAKHSADLLVSMMKKQGIIEDEDSPENEALGVAIAVMRTDRLPAKDKLAAARLVLDFTKAKPQSKSELTVKSAEDWLSDVVADHEKEMKAEDGQSETTH